MPVFGLELLANVSQARLGQVQRLGALVSCHERSKGDMQRLQALVGLHLLVGHLGHALAQLDLARLQLRDLPFQVLDVVGRQLGHAGAPESVEGAASVTEPSWRTARTRSG